MSSGCKCARKASSYVLCMHRPLRDAGSCTGFWYTGDVVDKRRSARSRFLYSFRSCTRIFKCFTLSADVLTGSAVTPFSGCEALQMQGNVSSKSKPQKGPVYMMNWSANCSPLGSCYAIQSLPSAMLLCIPTLQVCEHKSVAATCIGRSFAVSTMFDLWRCWPMRCKPAAAWYTGP